MTSIVQISQGEVQNFYKEETVTIPAGGEYEIFNVFDYFRCLSLSGTGLQLIFGDNPLSTPFTGAGIGVKLSHVVSRLKIRNTSGASMTISYAMAMGVVNDDRLNVSGNINAISVSPSTLPSTADVAVAATSTVLVKAANTSRSEIIISNLEANATKIRVGDASVGAARGIEVPVGGSLVLTTLAAVYVYNPSASGINIGVSETV